MRSPFVAGNWKMNTTVEEAERLAEWADAGGIRATRQDGDSS